MSRFQTQTHIRTIRGVALKDKPFQLTQDLVYRTDVLQAQTHLVIPTGFRTDFLTIPWFFRRLFSVVCKARDAALPHDYCCDPIDRKGNPIPYFCNHIEAAEIFQEAMLDIGVGPKMAATLSWAVKRGGPKFKAGELPPLITNNK